MDFYLCTTDIFWQENIKYTFGKDLRIFVDVQKDRYPRWILIDRKIKNSLDFCVESNIYACEEEKGFFFTDKDDAFYSYGSTGFFVFYAEPFHVKLLKNPKFFSVAIKRQEIVNKALSQYPEGELEYIHSPDELTPEEFKAYKRLQEQAKVRIEMLKRAGEYP